jgi:acetyltransferase-like isoleucine patch superfamily enzyme
MFNDLRRRILLKRKYRGISIFRDAMITGSGEFTYGSNCFIGPNCAMVLSGSMKLGSDVNILQGCEFECQDIDIGNQASVQRNSTILGKVKIGSYCVLGPNLYIASGSHEFRLRPELNIRDQDGLKHQRGIPAKKVEVGEDCWFGINVVVREGVTIGKGCVIGANSVVTKDVPPYSVAAGAPARILARRLEFDPPGSIHPCDEHVPYYYEGFRTRVSERAADSIRLSAPEFTIAVAIGAASTLRMNVSGIASIRSGKERFPVRDGSVTLPVSALESRSGLIRLACEGDWEKAVVGRIWAE